MIEFKKLTASALLVATSASNAHASTALSLFGFDATDDGIETGDVDAKVGTLHPVSSSGFYDITYANGKAIDIDANARIKPSKTHTRLSHTIADWIESSEHQGTTASSSDDLSALISAAQLGDVEAFTAAFRLVDWNQKPEGVLIKGISLALQMNATLIARDLAHLALQNFPGSRTIGDMNNVLSPPKAIAKTQSLQRIDVRANNLWIQNNSAKFGGQYIALRNGQLLASGPSMRSVIDYLAYSSTDDVLFTRII